MAPPDAAGLPEVVRTEGFHLGLPRPLTERHSVSLQEQRLPLRAALRQTGPNRFDVLEVEMRFRIGDPNRWAQIDRDGTGADALGARLSVFLQTVLQQQRQEARRAVVQQNPSLASNSTQLDAQADALVESRLRDTVREFMGALSESRAPPRRGRPDQPGVAVPPRRGACPAKRLARLRRVSRFRHEWTLALSRRNRRSAAQNGLPNPSSRPGTTWGRLREGSEPWLPQPDRPAPGARFRSGGAIALRRAPAPDGAPAWLRNTRTAGAPRTASPAQSGAPRSPGERLRAARLRRKISLIEAEQATRIRARYLQALEEDEYAALPSGVYSRGFLRNYAIYLGVPPDEVMAAIPKGRRRERRPGVRSVAPPIKVSAPRSIWLIAAAAAGVLVLVALIWLGLSAPRAPRRHRHGAGGRRNAPQADRALAGTPGPAPWCSCRPSPPAGPPPRPRRPPPRPRPPPPSRCKGSTWSCARSTGRGCGPRWTGAWSTRRPTPPGRRCAGRGSRASSSAWATAPGWTSPATGSGSAPLGQAGQIAEREFRSLLRSARRADCASPSLRAQSPPRALVALGADGAPPQKTFFIENLGCPKNAVEGEGMAERLTRAGYDQVSTRRRGAAVVVVNTCSFIRPAQEESIARLFHYLGRRREGQKVVAAGCLAERFGEALTQDIPELDGVLGTRRWFEIDRLVQEIERGGRPCWHGAEPVADPDVPAPGRAARRRTSRSPRAAT